MVLLPFRDEDNRQIQYITNPSAPNASQSTAYDSDFEPLIAPTSVSLDDDSLQHFTATGRPMQAYKHSNLMGLAGGDMYSLPQLLPKRYTDDSIIPAIVVGVIPAAKIDGENGSGEGKKRKGSFLGKLKGKKDEGKEGKGLTKVVYMPRREYLKFFARGLKGEYIGTEPWRQWSEEELEREFGRYKPEPPKKGYRAPT